jgi:hypothetical protein
MVDLPLGFGVFERLCGVHGISSPPANVGRVETKSRDRSLLTSGVEAAAVVNSSACSEEGSSVIEVLTCPKRREGEGK